MRIVSIVSLCFVTVIAVGCGGSTFTSSDPDGGADGSVADGGVTNDGSSNVDAGPTTDGGPAPGDGGLGLEGGVGSCSGSAAIFSNVIKGCTVASACVVVLHQIDCCGSMAAVGINHASKDAFAADEMAWTMTCPGCGCSAKPTIAEDGKTSTNASDFKAACVNNECRSYLP